MNIENRLIEIWNKYSDKNIPNEIKERGFVFCENNNQKDILITGINPSFRKSDSINSYISFNFLESIKGKYDNYWSPLKKMLFNEELNINLIDKSSYLDILYFREQNQKILKNKILKTSDGIHFIAEQLNLTQHIIEYIIQPRLIVVKNKESQAYWGKFADKNIFWMGYEFEFIENSYYGELFKIKGLHKSKERVANEITETNLKGTYVLFSYHINQYTSKEKRIRVETLNKILKK